MSNLESIQSDESFLRQLKSAKLSGRIERIQAGIRQFQGWVDADLRDKELMSEVEFSEGGYAKRLRENSARVDTLAQELSALQERLREI